MLPDFPNLKRQLQRLVNSRLRASYYRELGFASEIPRFSVKEGDGWAVQRADGTIDSSNFGEMSTAPMVIDTRDLPTLSPQALGEKLDAMAKDMAEQTIRKVIETLKQSRNVVNAQGAPLGPETLLEALDKIEIDFEGGSHNLTMLVGPELYRILQTRIPEWEKDEQLTRRHAELMERKRDEWRTRETRRKLAD